MCHIRHVSFDKKPNVSVMSWGFIKEKRKRTIPVLSIYDYDDIYQYIYYLIVIIINNTF